MLLISAIESNIIIESKTLFKNVNKLSVIIFNFCSSVHKLRNETIRTQKNTGSFIIQFKVNSTSYNDE